jgi:tetratricopeptide (TPR) repeat protein
MSSFIADLKSRIPQSEWPLIVAALRNEATLWVELEDGFGAQALEAAADSRECWSPAFLGLLRLDQAQQFELLRAAPMEPIAEKLRYQAASAYEIIATQGADKAAPTLEQATLLALALRERARLLNGWEQMAENLNAAPAAFWKLPMAILIGIVPQPREVLAALLSKTQGAELHSLALHALVSNPITLDEQTVLLLDLISDFELPQFLTILRSLAHMHLPLAQQVAVKALEKMESVPTGAANELGQIERLLLQAEVREISGQHNEAMPLLQAAWGAAQKFQAELASKMAESAVANGENAAGFVAIQEAGNALAKSTGAERKHPAALIAAARVALRTGDAEEAANMAAAALNAAQQSGAAENAGLMRQLGEIFLELNQPAEAKQAAELAAQTAPNDAENAAFLSKVMVVNNDAGRALQAAHLAAALAPERIDLRRQLAKALQANQQSSAALLEWQAVLAQDANASNEDLFAMAQAALAADEIGACIEACQRVLTAQATHGAAHALLGKALLAQDDASSAMEHLRRATELAPAQSEAWITLAEQQRANNSLQEARDTLLNAQQFAKPSAELQALLGEIYLALTEKEAALAAFSRAAELAVEVVESAVAQRAAWNLGKLQFELGHHNQARHTLERAAQNYPSHPGIAHQYAKLLLAAGEREAALVALTVTLQSEANNSEALMDAARAQMLPGGEADKAEACLRSVLASKAAPAEARGLLAETLAAQAKHQDAGVQFEAALKSELGKDAMWSKRLTLGKALSQAGAGKPESAIRTLEDMDRAAPGDLDVLRALCGAYGEAGRNAEAMQIASKVYLTSTKDEDTVLWFAEQATAFGKSEEARSALTKGIRETNSAAEILRLAEIEWNEGEHEKAVDTLAALLNTTNTGALAKAGRFLMERGAAATGVSYFKRAVEHNGDPSLLDALTSAYEHSHQWSEALATVEKSIAAEPKQPALLTRKAKILQAAGRPQAALEALEQAIAVQPQDAGLLATKARLLRTAQDWTGALAAAEQAFNLDVSKAATLQLAAELSLATLQPERARALFAAAKTGVEAGVELACLQVELALDANEEVQAAKALAPALDDEEHPRVLALQSQLAARRGDLSQAAAYLQSAMQFINTKLNEQGDAFNLLSVARAALRLNDFETAINLLQLVVKLCPGQALAQINLGKAIVQRAEWQQLCEASRGQNGAPGAIAIGKEAYAASKAAFAASLSAAPFTAARVLIENWIARAELRFVSKIDLANLPKGYPSNAGEAAALIYAARNGGDLKTAEERAKSFARTPEVLVERALAHFDINPSDALKWMQGALEQKPHVAAYYALAARFAELAGEGSSALGYIQQALGLAPAQAAWQSFAGKLEQAAGELNEAIQYFQHAIAHAPLEAEQHYELGQVQMQAHSFSDAVAAFAQASKLEPKSARYALALADAYKEAGELKLAAEKAVLANKLDPRSNGGLLLQTEIALQNDDAAGAKTLAESALRLNVKDSNALALFAESLNALGHVEDAVDVLARAEEAAADKLPLQIRRAQLLPIEAGLDEMLQLSKQHPDRADVYFALSQMLATRGDLQDAIVAAQRAAKKAEKLGRPVQASLHLHLGKLLKASGQLDQSLHHLDEAAELAPHLVESQLERGRVFLDRRQFKAAMDAFTQAAGIAPNSAQPHIEAALALKEAKDYDAAEGELRKAAKLAPKDRSIQRQLAAVIALNLIHHPQEVSAL